MEPIVNGLNEEFQGQMAFERRDANTVAGEAVMDAFNLRGHPSYVIVDPNGQELWKFRGQVARDVLRAEIARQID